ncbi:hypothetical protein DFH08DRAFT_808151 [Mycena albidolilacea]|uniref:Uncharacterized protein n=1 Tax=Mycena albidolilacea TaxID=1033008 RepID=A0AAD7A3S6_9AGAR|nr:hypothetical protein DFH08DRAFT_808151 [Mycena albidolilacea]
MRKTEVDGPRPARTITDSGGVDGDVAPTTVEAEDDRGSSIRRNIQDTYSEKVQPILNSAKRRKPFGQATRLSLPNPSVENHPRLGNCTDTRHWPPCLLLYASLNNHALNNRVVESLAGTQAASLLVHFQAGASAIAALGVSASTAFLQCAWRVVRKRPFTVSGLDALSSSPSNVLAFFSWDFWRTAREIVPLVTLTRAFPGVVAFAPGTLAVENHLDTVSEICTVPTYNFGSGMFLPCSASLWNSSALTWEADSLRFDPPPYVAADPNVTPSLDENTNWDIQAHCTSYSNWARVDAGNNLTCIPYNSTYHLTYYFIGTTLFVVTNQIGLQQPAS